MIEENGEIFIQDLGSTFATFVNGGKISVKTKLQKNDRVKIGTQLFHWQYYISDEISKRETNPIFLKDLFLPNGIVNWSDYKLVLIIALGAIIIIPFSVPTILTIGKYYVTRSNHALREEIDVWPYVEPLSVFFIIVGLYIFLNLTQKMIRGLIRQRS